MIRLIEEKQVGELSYFTKEPIALVSILDNEEIRRSLKEENNPATGKKQHYVSFSRNMTAATKRNPDRWRYGILIDGTKLSNRYKIEPVSYVGITTRKSAVNVKYIAAYENGTYFLNLVRFPTIQINRATYMKLRDEIESLPDDVKQLKKLIYQSEGKRKVNGTKIKEKYYFNVPTGGLRITDKQYPELVSALQKDTGLNEYEERIWLDNSSNFISIRGCILAVILPNNFGDDEFEKELKEYLQDSEIKIIYY